LEDVNIPTIGPCVPAFVSDYFSISSISCHLWHQNCTVVTITAFQSFPSAHLSIQASHYPLPVNQGTIYTSDSVRERLEKATEKPPFLAPVTVK
jgi:hypothetical protein